MNRAFRVSLFLLLTLRMRLLDMSKKPKIDHEDRGVKALVLQSPHSSLMISGLSYKTAFKSELWTSILPL
jgi:hypothetical protein